MQLLRGQLLLISICCYCSQLVESSSAHFNPYEVLNVPRSAPFDEIKRAYKRLALKYHPDRNANDPLTANNKFIQVNEAYQVLSNERSRSMYDTFNIIDSSSNQNNPFNKSPASDPHEPTPTPMPEETATVAHRFMNGMQRINNRIGVSFQRREILPIVSVLGTIIVMLFLGFILSYFDPANVEKRKRSRVVVFGQKPSQREYNGRLIHELKPQTFNGLVRCLKPGCRSIIILVNNATKDELIQRFGDIIYPYRKNKSLNFGYLNVDVATRLDWYRRLLQQTLVNLNRQLQLIPHKCIGTVLVLGGMRRYYSIYHAMHKESQPRIRRRGTLQSGVTSSVSGNDDTTCSSYIEFESDTDADEFDDEASCERASACDAESAVRENNADVDEARDPPSYDELVKQNIINPVSPEYLLAGLDLWLERLFDMKLQKYYISVWPNLR